MKQAWNNLLLPLNEGMVGIERADIVADAQAADLKIIEAFDCGF